MPGQAPAGGRRPVGPPAGRAGRRLGCRPGGRGRAGDQRGGRQGPTAPRPGAAPRPAGPRWAREPTAMTTSAAESSSRDRIAADPLLAELVERLTARLQAGEPVDVDAFAAQHPE